MFILPYKNYIFHYIIFFISNTHHQRKLIISRINPSVVMVTIFVRILTANLTISWKIIEYANTKSYVPYKNPMK